MISFRYHIVSLVAIFLALAVGVIVGTAALQGPVTNDLRSQVKQLKQQRTNAQHGQQGLQQRFADAQKFASVYGAQLVTGQLKGSKVLIVGMPGASTGVQDALASELAAAGATTAGRLELSGGYDSQAQASSIVAMVTGPVHPTGLKLPSTSDGRALGAALLSYVLTGKGNASDLRSALSGFAGLQMTTSNPASISPATSVVVVGTTKLGKNSYAAQSELDLVGALRAEGARVVVAGNADSAASGVVAAVRSGATRSTVSTVDDADTAFGQVSTVLALAQAAQSQVGQYGTAAGAQALFPSPGN